MKTLTLIALLTAATTSFAGPPCDDARKDFNRAKKFGATTFACEDFEDGSATSTWMMSPEQFEKFSAAERKRRSDFIKGKPKGERNDQNKRR